MKLKFPRRRLSAFLSLLTWISLVILVNVTTPTPSAQILFFIILFLAVFFTLRLFIKKIKFRLLISFYLVFFPLLLLFNQFSYLNLGLLTALFISLLILIRQTPS